MMMSPGSMAMSVPAPMATPTLVCMRAGASLSHGHLPLLLQLPHDLRLALGQHAAEDLLDPQLRCDSAGGGLVFADDQHRGEVGVAHCCHRLHGVGSQLVTEGQHAEGPALAADGDDRYGKLLRTLHALRWFTDEAFRLRIGRQLNRGEALNDLRRFIFFAKRGHRALSASRRPDHPGALPHAGGERLHPVHNRLPPRRHRRPAGGRSPISEDAIAHLSPAHFEVINPFGTLAFGITGVLKRSRRPLRRSKAVLVEASLATLAPLLGRPLAPEAATRGRDPYECTRG
jgi:hypothetical protein